MAFSGVSRCLPFPRGYTMADGIITPGDTGRDHLEGKLYEVPDTEHGSGVNVILMAVKNDTGAAITVARKFGEFSAATALDHGRRIGQFPCNTAGAVVLPLDDAYTVGASIADDDIFYVVVYGYCDVLTGASVASLAAAGAVASDNAGLIADQATAAAGEFVVGTLDYAASYSANTATTIFVNPPSLNLPPAAG